MKCMTLHIYLPILLALSLIQLDFYVNITVNISIRITCVNNTVLTVYTFILLCLNMLIGCWFKVGSTTLLICDHQ
jgi:hypothetical protein